MLKIWNTLTREKEDFNPIKDGKVSIYTCGPTVYSRAHIGNMRTYIFMDTLRKVLKYNGYELNHVMNITDVGHLTSDADEGEDKMEKSAKEKNMSVYEIAKIYTDAFFKDIGKFIALILLVLQLAAAGGTFPIETVTKGFRWLHPILPMTYTIDLLRESLVTIESKLLTHNFIIVFVIFIVFLGINIAHDIIRQKKNK